MLNYKECGIKLFGWVGGSRGLGMAGKNPLIKILELLPSSYESTTAKLTVDEMPFFPLE